MGKTNARGGRRDGRVKEGGRANGGLHGRWAVAEMASDGRRGGERRSVGGGVVPLREPAPLGDMAKSVGGFCLNKGVYWRYTLIGDERGRTARSTKDGDETGLWPRVRY